MASRRNRYKQSGPGDVSGHRDLGKAVLRLTDGPVAEPRTTKRQLTYVLSKRTGASAESVARQLGVTVGTLRRWIRGKQKPSGRNTERVAGLYDKFWRINNDPKKPRKRPRFKTASLTIENLTNPDGIVILEGPRNRIVNPLLIGPSSGRNLKDILRATTPEEAYRAFVKGVMDPSEWPSVPEYLDFLEGDYAIRVG